MKEPQSELLRLQLSFEENLSQIRFFSQDVEAIIYRASASGPVLKEYVLAVSRRLGELGLDTLSAVADGRAVTASMTGRGIIETVGAFHDFVSALRSAKNRNDREHFREVLKRHFFASREFHQEYAMKAPHVADGIRSLEKQMAGAEDIYNILCEAVHPNWAGVGGMNLMSDEDNAVHMRSTMAALATEAAFRAFDKVARASFTLEFQPKQMVGW